MDLSPHKFHVNVKYMDIQAKVNGVVINDTLDFAVNAGDNVEQREPFINWE